MNSPSSELPKDAVIETPGSVVTNKSTYPWSQFSLRAFVAVLTLMVVVLAWFINGPDRQRRVVAELRSKGAIILYYDTDDVTHTVPDDGWLPPDYYLTIGSVTYENKEGADSIAAAVATCRGVRHIDFHGSDLSNDGLSQLGRLTSLSALHLSDTKITDSGLSALPSLLNLKVLWLARTEIGDEGAARISEIPELTSLDLGSTRITDSGLRSIASARALTYLALHNTSITDKGLSHLKSLHLLESLVLSRTRITGSGLDAIGTMPALQHLTLSHTETTDESLDAMMNFPNLKVLDLSWNTKISGQGIHHLQHLRALEKLILAGTKVTDGGADRLVELPQLSTLDVRDTLVTDEWIAKWQERVALRLRNDAGIILPPTANCCEP